MPNLIGIRREDKNEWERRVPLIPRHLRELKLQHTIDARIQPSDIRTFTNNEYTEVGVAVEESLEPCKVIFAVKEIPLDFFEHGKTYVFFSHTIKGQAGNMPMLKRMMDLGCTLIDYEKIVDENGRRLIFFGWHAGIAGMIDTLWAFGQRLKYEGISNPFTDVQQTHHYKDLSDGKEQISRIGKKIAADGLPTSIVPLVCGFAGYGNVFRGANEIIDLLPVIEIHPTDLAGLFEGKKASRKAIYKVVFKEEHTVEPLSASDTFDLKDYIEHPEKYRSRFHEYVPYLTILVNCIYWEKRYPRLVTKDFLKGLFTQKQKPRLRVIGDISCDIEGGIECTTRPTDPGNPVYVYNPLDGSTTDGIEGTGLVVMAVDNLPCELAKEASTDFSQALVKFVPEISKADFSVPFEKLTLSREIKDAMILYHGELTPRYRYLEKYVGKTG